MEKWGDSIDQAVDLALRDMKLTRDDVDVEVLEEPSKGFLGIIGNTLDLFCTTNLLSQWSLMGEVPVGVSVSTAEVFVARIDMPDSPANMPTAAFFDAATHDDTDGDGLYDGREIRLHGTDPARWDTDGDGLADGYEVAQGLSPLLLDTDADGYPDDEEITAQTDPLSPNAGASGSIRYFYDDDDRLVSVYVGLDGGASTTHWSSSGNPDDVQIR